MAVTENDIERIYDKMETADNKLDAKIEATREESRKHIEGLNRNLSDLITTSAVIGERFKQMSENINNLPIPEQPCIEFKDHIEKHERFHWIWLRAIITAIVGIVAGAITAAWALITKGKP